VSAILDATRTYRYRLDRHLHDFGNGGKMLVVMLNPSTADETQDDPTIRRVKAFAIRHACTSLTVCNLYAYRATSPATLKVVSDPVGPENEAHLRQAASEAKILVAAWGASHLGGAWPWKVRELLAQYGPVHAFRLTKSGDPGHPLYVPADAPLIEWAGGSGGEGP
jgi:hypothetical protein